MISVGFTQLRLCMSCTQRLIIIETVALTLLLIRNFIACELIPGKVTHKDLTDLALVRSSDSTLMQLMVRDGASV